MRRPSPGATFLAASVLIFSVQGCAYLYPEPDPESPEAKRKEEPLFESETYAENAKTYFHGGQYARAREQWEQQLKKEPGNWMAELGLSSCDYFLGDQALDRGDVKTARELFARSEQDCRRLFGGELGADTKDTESSPVQPWKAALILAHSLRGLGDADHLEARMAAEGQGGLPNDPKTREAAATRERLEKRRTENWKASLALFDRLVAMKNASEDAILNAAELEVQLGRPESGERHFLRYLEIAEGSRQAHEAERARLASAPLGPNPKADEVGGQFLDSKIRSNSVKQSAVLVRLGNLHFDRGVASLAKAEDPSLPATARKAHEVEGKRSFTRSLDYLNQARGLQPERLDILVKLAQCQGQLGMFEPAIDNLDRYIAASGEKNDPFDDNLKRAFRMKREYEMKLGERRR